MNEKKEKVDFFEVPHRQLGSLIGIALILGAATFIAGYFLGAYQSAESFMIKSEQDSFADQVYASLSAIYDQDIPPAIKEDIPTPPTEEVPEESKSSADSGQEITEIPFIAPEQIKEEKNDKPEKATPKKNKIDVLELAGSDTGKTGHWYAKLIGYGLEKSARTFAQKLTSKGFDVAVASRVSHSAAGKERRWYQVVTTAYEDRDLLQKQIDKIVSLEKLKGVQISTC